MKNLKRIGFACGLAAGLFGTVGIAAYFTGYKSVWAFSTIIGVFFTGMTAGIARYSATHKNPSL